MHKERSNCSWIGMMVYIIFIFSRMGAGGGYEALEAGTKTEIGCHTPLVSLRKEISVM